jgi:transcriptional regulator with XRE-family HTH domain
MNKRLKEVRKALGLNQEDFSKQIGIAQNSYSLIETGKINLTERNIKVICLIHNVSEEWLRNGTGEMFNKPLEVQDNEEKRLLALFRKLTTEMKQVVLKKIEELLALNGSWAPPSPENQEQGQAIEGTKNAPGGTTSPLKAPQEGERQESIG